MTTAIRQAHECESTQASNQNNSDEYFGSASSMDSDTDDHYGQVSNLHKSSEGKNKDNTTLQLFIVVIHGFCHESFMFQLQT